MRFDLEALDELPGVLAGRLPGALDVGSLTDAELTGSLAAIGAVRRELDAATALIAATVARRSTRDLGTDGLAQRRGHKDGAGLVEELTGIGRAEAAKLIRVGGLLETAHAVAPVPPENGGGEPGFESGREVELGGAGAPGTVDGPWAALTSPPPPRDIAALAGLSGPWHTPIAVALRNRWLTAAQSDALRVALGTPPSGAPYAGPGDPRGDAVRGAPGAAPTAEAADRWREAAIELIDDCWTGKWSPEDLARAAKRMRAALDTCAAHEQAQQRYEMRCFKRAVRPSGMVHYDIDLDPESDARFYGPIKRLLSPRFGGPRFTAAPDRDAATRLEADPRTNEQLQVDTLVELIDRAVAADAKELFKTSEPQVMIAVTANDLAAGRAGIAWIDGRDEPITALDALRMVCASGFTPALFDESGRAIDIGKDQRLFSRVQRRALSKRDGGCLYPGCDRPPEDCESHHINPWAGHPSHRKTEVRDGVLLCRRHHKLIHDHGAAIERRGHTYWLRWPGRAIVRLHPKAALQSQLRHQARGAPGNEARSAR